MSGRDCGRLWRGEGDNLLRGAVLVTGDSQGGERCVFLVLFSVRVAWVVGHIVLRICWSWRGVRSGIATIPTVEF